MPAPVTLERRWTLDEFYRERDTTPPGERWEFVDGEVLVTTPPHWTHQRVQQRLAFLLAEYVRAEAVGEVFVSPLDVYLEPNLVLQPDVLIVPTGLLRRGEDRITKLLLAVEILSPDSARHDRVRKRPAYQRNRVPEYWVIDPVSETVERWRPDDQRPEVITGLMQWHPAGATGPFQLDVPQFIEELLPPR